MKSYSFANLTVRGFPTELDMNNPWIYGSVQVMVNVCEHEYPPEILKIIRERGIECYNFPLQEDVPDMGLENILKAVDILDAVDKEGKKILLHCSFGNNRSRTVAECFHFMRTGVQLEDEYKGYLNHLVFNCENGHLPALTEVEDLLSKKRF